MTGPVLSTAPYDHDLFPTPSRFNQERADAHLLTCASDRVAFHVVTAAGNVRIRCPAGWPCTHSSVKVPRVTPVPRSAEHTSELQSRGHLVCRLLLEEKNKN